jgi:hypothetical protein
MNDAQASIAVSEEESKQLPLSFNMSREMMRSPVMRLQSPRELEPVRTMDRRGRLSHHSEDEQHDRSVSSIHSRSFVEAVTFVDKLFTDRLNESRPRSSVSMR